MVLRSVLFVAAVLALATHAAVAAPSDEAVKQVIDRWLAAQNRGKFDDYASLYADDFVGVKRVGTKNKSMKRAAWLADRKKMFKKPMIVTASDLKVSLEGDAATVELTQGWRQGSFADRGKKRLKLANRSGWIIVAEEMLDSHVVLTDAACVELLYPGGSLSKMRAGPDADSPRIKDVTVLELGGDRWACRGESRYDDDTKVERADFGVVSAPTIDAVVAVLHFGTRWKEIGRVEHSYSDWEEDYEGERGELAIEVIPISKKENALLVAASERRYGGELDVGKEHSVLYRVTGAAIVELLSFDSEWNNGEGDDQNKCSLDVGTKVRKGYSDLVVECVQEKHDWHGDEHQSESERTVYRWDGSGYAEK